MSWVDQDLFYFSSFFFFLIFVSLITLAKGGKHSEVGAVYVSAIFL